jgi:hypothetical protein
MSPAAEREIVPPGARVAPVAGDAPRVKPDDAVVRTAGELFTMLEAQCAGSASAEARLDLFEIVAYDGAVVHVRARSAEHEVRVRSLEQWIGERLSQAAGRRVRAVAAAAGSGVGGSGASGAAPVRERVSDSVRTAAAQADPVVRLALDLFDGRIVGIEGGSGGGSAE